jgi:hypothetical protein
MAWQRIQLRHIETGEPLSSQWTPTARESELHDANRALEQRNLPYRWQPIDPRPPLP